MAYIFDSTYGNIKEEQRVLTVGTLVWVGSVYIDRKKGNYGIIIGVDEYNFGIGECVFLVYSNGQIIKTAHPHLVW